MTILLLNKSFVKEHQRRKKDGSVYTIAAHYNKRVKKNTEHAPAHNHDLSHLSAEEGAQFNQMHAEQHLAKHYDEHTLKQQMQDSKGEHDKLVQEADIQEKLGNHKAATKLRNKAIKVNQRMMRFQRQLSKLDETVQGIGQMKDKLVAGSGALTDDAIAHANYVSKLGAKYKGRIIFPKKVAKPKAAFIPTHTLSDGVPAKHVEDNVYIDKDGNEVQDHYAEPVARKADDNKQGDFGPILHEFYHDANGAIARLTELQDGEAVAALHHPDVGDIDLAWGKEGTAKSDGYGLSKLIKYHPEVLSNLQGLLLTLTKNDDRSTERRIQLESKDHQAGIKLDWDGKKKTWLLTAFEKKTGNNTSTDTIDISGKDDTARSSSSPDKTIPQSSENATENDEPKYRVIKYYLEKLAEKNDIDVGEKSSSGTKNPKDYGAGWKSTLYADNENKKRASFDAKHNAQMAYIKSGGRLSDEEYDKISQVFSNFLTPVERQKLGLDKADYYFMSSANKNDVKTFIWEKIKRFSLIKQYDNDLNNIAFNKPLSFEKKKAVPDEDNQAAKTVSVALKDSPKEGERNAEGLVFRNGRWHREDEDKEGKLSKLREKIKEAGGKEQVSKVLLTMARSSEGEITAHGIKSDAIKLVDMLVQSTGLTKEEVLNELGIKSKSARSKTLIVAKELHKDVEKLADEDNPNSPNYRFRDTGYIGGSRKEDAALMIRSAAKGGLLVRSTAIDWEEIEKNPREAHQLITKSNLFGKVDWDSLKADGMEPSAGFLVDRIYASVAKEPEDNASIRKDYVAGIETLRDRLETCKTPDEVVKVLAEIRGEYEGTMLSATESEEYQKANNEANRLGDILRAANDEKDVFFQRWYSAQINANKVGYEQEARKRRKWKSSPELDARYAELRAVESQYNKDYMDYLSAHPELKSVPSNKVDGFHMNFDNELEHNLRQARSRANTILNSAKAKNLYENPVTRAWISLGPKFHAVLNYRNYKGSGAFGGHVTSAKTGKINDWSWAESSGATKSPRSTEAQVKFQLKVADSYDRIGGAAISSDSTSSLKAMFNLRDVQSGNWVLKDINSAKFHVQRSAEAFSDLADILGSDKEKVSMNGRLAMAFGARGKGNAGFGGAAAAHYEPVQRIINLTKMGGGGSLAHEWFHAMDNMTSAAVNGVDGSAKDFVSENLDLLPQGELRDAWSNLIQVMNHGDHYATKKITYTDKDYRLAIHNIDRPSPGKLATMIKDAPDVHKAVRAVESYFGDSTSKRSIKSMNDWIKVAAAYHDKNAAGGSAFVKAGAPMSSFAAEARSLDGGVIGKYWSQSPEIAARAFQAYVEDKLQSMGRKNDYLSAFADNKYYKDPIFGNTYPFPEGEERKAINALFDRLMLAMKKENVLAKAADAFSKPMILLNVRVRRA